MRTERWLPVCGHPNYEVSDLGRVRSLDHEIECLSRWGTPITRFVKGRVRKPQRTGNGYIFVVMSGDEKSHLVHRLVAVAFIAGDTSLTVNHKDGVRTNNCVGNLEWMTYGENIKHSYSALDRKQHALTKPVAMGGSVYPSMSAAAKHYGVHAGSVLSALKRGHLCCGVGVTHG